MPDLSYIRTKTWAEATLETTYASFPGTSTSKTLALSDVPDVSRVTNRVDDGSPASPYHSRQVREHDMTAWDVSLSLFCPVGTFSDPATNEVWPLDPIMKASGFERADNVNAGAGPPEKTFTYTPRTAAQQSMSLHCYKLAEDLSSGNRQFMEGKIVGCRGTFSIVGNVREILLVEFEGRGLVDTGADGPFWQPVDDKSGTLTHTIPSLSELNEGRERHVASDGSITLSSLQADALRSLEIAEGGDTEDIDATASNSSRTTHETRITREDAPTASFEIPAVEAEVESSGLIDKAESTRPVPENFEVEYTESLDDGTTEDSKVRLKADHYVPYDVGQGSVGDVMTWDVEGACYGVDGDDEMAIQVFSTEDV